MSSQSPLRLRVLVIGDSGVGKTSLIRRFVEGKHCRPTATIGIDYGARLVTDVCGELVRISFLDCSGALLYRHICEDFYKDANSVSFTAALIHATAIVSTSTRALDMLLSWSRMPTQFRVMPNHHCRNTSRFFSFSTCHHEIALTVFDAGLRTSSGATRVKF